MESFNLIVFLWRVSFFVSVIAFLYGLSTKSWIAMVISSITFLPIAYYFNGANNEWRLVALIPFMLGAIAFIFWKKQKTVR